jgi:hypothetical protein
MNGTEILLVAGLVFLVFGTLLTAAIIIVRMDLRITRKRTAVFEKVADEMDLDFHPQGINGYWGDISQFDLFQHGRTRWFRNVMHGRAKGMEVCVFDYQYTTGSDRHPQCRHQTAVGFRTSHLALPDFDLRLKAWGDAAGPWAPALTREVQAGYRDIVFVNREEFSRHYQLFSIDEAAVRRSFTGELLDYFAAHPDLNVEAHGDRLLVYGKAVRATPEAIRELTEAGFNILAWFRARDMPDV